MKITNRSRVLFTVILVLAAFLRFTNLVSVMPFTDDQGQDFIEARDALQSGTLPLLGIESSVPRFSQGPVYIWLLMIIFNLFGYDPVNAGIAASALGLFTVGLLFIITQKWWGMGTAIIATLVYATSPLAVTHDRFAFITNLIPLCALVYLHSIIDFLKNPKRSLLLPGIAFGLLFLTELATAPLFLLIPAALLLKQTRLTIQSIVNLTIGLTIGLLPKVLYDLTHGFSQIGLFVVWIGYRLASFVGFVDREHTFSLEKINTVFMAIVEFTHKFFSWHSTLYVIIIITILIISLLTLVMQIRFQKIVQISGFLKNQPIYIIWFSLILLWFSFFIHGGPSDAHFVATYVLLSIVLGYALVNLNSPLFRNTGIAIVLFGCLANISILRQSHYLSRPLQNTAYPTVVWVSRLGEQQAVVNLIKSRAKGPFALKGIGPGSEFESFLANYRFLLWRENSQLDPNALDQVWLIRGPNQPPVINSISWPFEYVTVSLVSL